VTASAGNHGRGLAASASKVGLPLTVYVPASAPKVKLDAMRALGARLELCADYDEAERKAQRHQAPGVVYVSPYAHPYVIEGAGTVAIEILAQDPQIEVIVCPVGGGGLASGIAIAAAGRADTWGVETEASCPFTRSLAAGRIVTIDVQPSLADGLTGNLDPETITFDLVRQHVAGIATVAEAQIESAVGQLAASERLIAEGAAAVGVAGVANGRVPLAGRRTAVVLTGANIDPDKLRQLI
jgi:threonine dehydratase